jgi:hypothetical protein
MWIKPPPPPPLGINELAPLNAHTHGIQEHAKDDIVISYPAFGLIDLHSERRARR